MALTAIWMANKLDGWDLGVENIAMSAMIVLRNSQAQEDWCRVQRLKAPSAVAHNVINYEFELIATTGFYIPANYQKLILEVTNKINCEMLKY